MDKPTKSKKFLAFLTGSVLLSLFSLTGLITMVLVPAIAASVVNLITVVLACLSGLISIYIGSQGAVDWKINSNHSTTKNSVDIKKEIVKDHKNFEMKYDDLDDIDWEEYERKLQIL
jgi:hypothetical protein